MPRPRAPAALLLALLLAVAVGDNAQAKARAVDGDSGYLANGERFRVNCIDAPEYDQPGGQAAKRQLAAFLRAGARARKQGKDDYGRNLTLLYVNGAPVNLAMLQMGHAWVYGGRLQNCGASKRVLCAAEKQARRARRGLWAAANPMPPYVWRNRHKRKFSTKQMKSACQH